MMYINPSASTWTFQGRIDPAVEQFHRRLPDYNSTPLVDLPDVASELGLKHVFIKDESHRFGLPAFKILGASWAVYKLVAEKCKMPLTCSLEDLSTAAQTHQLKLVTCTEGNWGRAVSRMGKYLNIPAVIYVPNFMDRATQNKIKSEGASVHVVDGDYDLSILAAQEDAAKSNGLLVMDTGWPGYEEFPQWVVEGYSTMLTETDRQVSEITGTAATCAIASVGVGSWAQAVAMHYKSKSPSATVITVEPETAACLRTSLETGEITSVQAGHTIMNGMCCGTVSYTAWPILKEGVDASVTISDRESHQSVRYLHEHGVKNGPCGAAPLSALKRLCEGKKLGLNSESVVVLFSTEGAREYITP